MQLKREFARYVIPTMMAYALMAVYVIVDTFFVANAVGDAGIAGVSIANPIYTIIGALGTGIGVSGSVIASIKVGEGDKHGAEFAVGTACMLLAIVSIPMLAITYVFATPLNDFLGGEGMSLTYAVDYTRVLAIGAPFQIIAAGLVPVLRNRGFVTFCMASSISSCVLNASLDWVFVVQMQQGTAGAATATVCAQIFLCVACLIVLLRKDQRIPSRCLIPQKEIVSRIAVLGLAPFSLTMLPVVTIAVVNITAMAEGGEQAVGAYGVIAGVTFLIQILIQSIGDGAQPLISRYLGAGDIPVVRKLRHMNYVCAISLGFIGLIGMVALRYQIPAWYGVSEGAAAITAYALPIFSMAYVFYGFTHASTTFFYAIDNAKYANALIIAEAVLVVPITFSMAFIIGINGVWWSMAIVQSLLSVIAAVLMLKARKCAALQVSEA